MEYIKKTDNPKMGRPSANLTHNIKVRIDDKLNLKLEEYAEQNGLGKASVIRQILADYFFKDEISD